LNLKRSHLLHRLDILQIHWGSQVDVSRKSGTFHEIWQLQWSPELAVDVVAASVWGTSVAAASEAYICHFAALSHELPALSNYVSKALLANLPDVIPDLLEIFDHRAAETSDIEQLMLALPALSNTLRYGNVRQTDSGMIAKVIESLITRIFIGLPGACASINDDSALQMYDRMNETHQAILILQNMDHLSSWQNTLLILANQSGLHGLIAGRATRLLLEMSQIDTNETARRLRLGLSTAAQPEQAGAWVEGFLKDSGTVLIHAVQLWQIIDHWVSTVDSTTFTHLLPLLRRTFSSFTNPERRQLGERVRQNSGEILVETKKTADFNPEQAQTVLPVLAQIFGSRAK
jgi:hypothetical protein